VFRRETERARFVKRSTPTHVSDDRVTRRHVPHRRQVPKTSSAKADGRFDKSDFVHDAKRDEYRCPAGERAILRMASEERGQIIRRY
jgi:hypothetical protein